MSQAILSFVGVILGALIASGVSLFREHVVTARERAARADERKQRMQDVRDAFQRETLVALQDANVDFRRATIAEYHQRLEVAEKSRSWIPLSQGDHIADPWRDQGLMVKKLWARVFDPELTAAVESFRLACWEAIYASDKDEATERLNHAIAQSLVVEEHIARLLPELYRTGH
jgi:hypothetical protein